MLACRLNASLHSVLPLLRRGKTRQFAALCTVHWKDTARKRGGGPRVPGSGGQTHRGGRSGKRASTFGEWRRQTWGGRLAAKAQRYIHVCSDIVSAATDSFVRSNRLQSCWGATKRELLNVGSTRRRVNETPEAEPECLHFRTSSWRRSLKPVGSKWSQRLKGVELKFYFRSVIIILWILWMRL